MKENNITCTVFSEGTLVKKNLSSLAVVVLLSHNFFLNHVLHHGRAKCSSILFFFEDAFACVVIIYVE